MDKKKKKKVKASNAVDQTSSIDLPPPEVK